MCSAPCVYMSTYLSATMDRKWLSMLSERPIAIAFSVFTELPSCRKLTQFDFDVRLNYNYPTPR